MRLDMDNTAIFQFLEQSFLFNGLDDEDLRYIASFVLVRNFQKDELIVQQGSRADAIHILAAGKVQLGKANDGKYSSPTMLVPGDIFGENALFPREVNRYSAICYAPAMVITLPRKYFPQLVREMPIFRENLLHYQSSLILLRKKKPSWVNQGERVYAFTQKSPVLFLLKQLVPTLVLLVVSASGFFAYQSEVWWAVIACGLAFLVLLAVDFWQFIDWQNDYYIITNQRVIWLEKVILLYDSRSEASLENILAVNTEMNLFGRMFDFGNVIVKTYTGQIKLRYVRRPHYFAAIAEQLVQRNKTSGSAVDKERIRQTLRNKLEGGDLPQPAQTKSMPAEAMPTRQKELLGGWFRMRTQDGATITYHKHIFGFIRDSYLYALGIVGTVGAIFFWEMIGYTIPLWFYMVLISACVLMFLVIIYQYWDWRNDIYQVTADQIFDIDKKPLGDEDRKVAQIENILSTEYKRNGIFGLVFNFGTVYIKVGNSEFNFEDVADPPSVQQDIIQRQLGLKKKKAEKTAEAENDKISEWLRAYHQHVQDGPE